MELNIQRGRLWKHNEWAYLVLSTSCVKRCWFILKVSHRDWISYQFFTINIPKYKISHFCYWIVMVTIKILNAQAEVEPVSLLVVWHGKLDNHNFGCFTTKEGREWQTTNPLIWLITYSLLPSPPPFQICVTRDLLKRKGFDTPKIFTWTRHFLHMIWYMMIYDTYDTCDMEINTEGHAWDVWLRNVDCVTERTDDALVNMYASKTNDDFFKLRRFDVRYCTSFWPWLWLWNETIQRRIMTRLVTPQLVRLGFMCSHL